MVDVSEDKEERRSRRKALGHLLSLRLSQNDLMSNLKDVISEKDKLEVIEEPAVPVPLSEVSPEKEIAYQRLAEIKKVVCAVADYLERADVVCFSYGVLLIIGGRCMHQIL